MGEITMKKQVIAGVILFLLALYLWSYKGTSHSPDEWLFIDMMAQALSTGFHTLPSGHVQYIGLYAIGIPLLVLSQLVENIGTYQILTFLNSIATAVTGGLIVALLLELDYKVEIAAIVAIVYGAGTLAWPYSGYLLREPLAAMGLTLAALLLLNYQKMGGFEKLLGWLLTFIWTSLTKRTTSFLIFPFFFYLAWIFYTRKEPEAFWAHWFRIGLRRKVLILISVILPTAILFWIATKNYVPFPQRFSDAFPDLRNLVGLLFSPGWGLFVFCPVLLLTIPGLPGFFRKKSGGGIFLAGLGLIYLVASTRGYFWWGFWGWGPRQVNPVLPFLCLPLAETIRLFGNKRVFMFLFGFLFLLSALFAGMQSLVAYPFYEVVFKRGITFQEFTWHLRFSPPLNHWRFLNLARAEVAWASTAGMRWTLFIPLTIFLFLVSLSARNLISGKLKGLKLNLSVLVLLFLALISSLLFSSYYDEDFGGKSGFVEAYKLLREKGNASDKLIVYMWGEPPWAYIPRVAMLNYCKGLCPPHIIVIKEQHIDDQPEWEEQLWRSIGNAENIWVVMQGLTETSPERWVEFALAKRLYYAGSKWTGPSVRVAQFKRGGKEVISAGRLGEGIELTGYTVKASSLTPSTSDFLFIELHWELPVTTISDWKTSLQLLDKRGKLACQVDYPVSLLMEPQSSEKEKSFTARYALELPETPGEYELILVLYSEQNRFIFSGNLDHIKLAKVEVLPLEH